jgi:hypothetical protein
MKRKCLAYINLTSSEVPKLDFSSLKSFQNDIKDFKHGARVWISIETYYKTRSLSQNALMHCYLQEIADNTGDDMERIKEILKKKFLTVPNLDRNGDIMCNPVTGEVMEYVKDTSKLTTIEMATFCEQIRMFAQDFGIYLEMPEEQREIKFKN